MWLSWILPIEEALVTLLILFDVFLYNHGNVKLNYFNKNIFK